MTLISRAITTLNIEGSSIRFLTARDRRVENWGNAPLPPGLVKDTFIADPDAVGAAIDGLFRAAGVSKNGVVVGITGLRSVSRFVTLPKLGPSQMRQAVRWAAKREMPVPVEDLYLSWQEIGTRDSEQLVFLLGTPRRIIDAASQALWRGGIKPHAIDLKPLALARAVNRPDAIIIDLENDSTSIVVLANSLPQLMHTMIVRQEGLHLDDRIQKLAEDLTRTVGFYNNAHPDQPIDSATPAFLTGEVAGIPLVLRSVRKTIGFPIGLPESCLEHSSDLPLAQYAVNMGLALGAMPPGQRDKTGEGNPCIIDVNVLSSDYHHNRRHNRE